MLHPILAAANLPKAPDRCRELEKCTHFLRPLLARRGADAVFGIAFCSVRTEVNGTATLSGQIVMEAFSIFGRPGGRGA